MRKIAVITGTRADYGLMRPVLEAIASSAALDLHLIVTGMHFLPQFASSLDQIREDKFGTIHEIPVYDALSDGSSMAKTLGGHLSAFADAFSAYRPDILLLQGDRGEMLAAAIAAAHMNIPVVHMSGGDRSGTIDDSIRHALSKFAHFHLPTCEQSRQTLLSFDEEPQRIKIVGEPALDVIRTFVPVACEEFYTRHGLPAETPFILAAQHPVTTESGQAAEQMRSTLTALIDTGLPVLLTAPNSDAGGAAMAAVIAEEVAKYPSIFRYTANLGHGDFLSAMSYAAAMVGNSSAGILESASFGLPVVNIGTRQHGRLRADNVMDTGYERASILSAITTALSDQDFIARAKAAINPYGDGTTAAQTVEILKTLKLDGGLLTKWIKGFNPL